MENGSQNGSEVEMKCPYLWPVAFSQHRAVLNEIGLEPSLTTHQFGLVDHTAQIVEYVEAC